MLHQQLERKPSLLGLIKTEPSDTSAVIDPMLRQQLTRDEQLAKQFMTIESEDSEKAKDDSKDHRLQLQHAEGMVRDLAFLLNFTSIAFLRIAAVTDEQVAQDAGKSYLRKLSAFHAKHDLDLGSKISETGEITTSRDMDNFRRPRHDRFQILQQAFEAKIGIHQSSAASDMTVEFSGIVRNRLEAIAARRTADKSSGRKYSGRGLLGSMTKGLKMESRAEDEDAEGTGISLGEEDS